MSLPCGIRNYTYARDMAILRTKTHWVLFIGFLAPLFAPSPVGLISAGLTAGIVGIIFGLPSVRVKGFYLAITTIAAQFIIIWVINHWGLTGGFQGISVPYASIGGLVFDNNLKQFYLVMVIVVLCVFLAKNL